MLPELAPEDIEVTVPPIATAVVFSGNTVLTSEQLREIAGIQPGDALTEEVLRQSAESIQQAYADRGYIAAVTEIELPTAGESGPLEFRIQELRMAEVRFEGLRRTRESAIRRMLTIQPGQVFNRNEVTRDFIRLQQLGLYESIDYVLQPVRPGEAALVWRLEERQTFNYIEAGGSYSPQDRLVGVAQLTLGNLRGRGERLNLLASVGSIDGEVGGELTYFNPWIAPRDTSLLLSAYSRPRYRFSRDLVGNDRYFERHTGFRGLINRLVAPDLSLAVGIRYEDVDVKNFPTDLEPDAISQDSTIALASLRATLDKRNSALNPTRGTYTIGFIEGGVADQDVGGSDAIGKFWGDRRWYLPLREESEEEPDTLVEMLPTLAFRLLLAGSAGNLPFYEQYFMGGIGDLPLRGYLEDRFWGKYAVLANVELRWPFNRSLAGVAFVDAGDAWGTDFLFEPGTGFNPDFEQHEDFSPHVGGGVGVRYSAAGYIIRLDFAYGDEFRTHFSVGQTF